jgi:hypothetical protein
MPTTNKLWLDTSNDFSATGNWSDSTAPTTGDGFWIASGSQAIVNGVTQNLVNPVELYVGPDFSGSIGSSGTPLYLGDFSSLDRVIINAPLMQAFFLRVTDVTYVTIVNCGMNENACVLQQGTMDKIRCLRGGAITIGSAVTAEDVLIGQAGGGPGDASVVIQASATVPTIEQWSGMSDIGQTTITTLTLHGGIATLSEVLSSAKTCATLTIAPGAVCRITGRLHTYTTVKNYGILDASKAENCTFTAIRNEGGARATLNMANIVTTLIEAGGHYSGPAPGTTIQAGPRFPV